MPRKFPHLLKLPPTNLEGPAAFFGLSLPPCTRQFANQHLCVGAFYQGEKSLRKSEPTGPQT